MSDADSSVRNSTLCFISSKGGSGKTVTALSIARMLAHLGFRVLIVDTDAATNGLTLLCLEMVVAAKKAAKEVLLGMLDPALGGPPGSDLEGAEPTPCSLEPNLDLIPASYTMGDTERGNAEIFELRLADLTWRFSSYDFIILDAQAGADAYARAAVKHSDQCVIVSEYDPISVQGIERLKVLFAGILRIESTWILFNKILPEFAKAIGEGLIVARYLPPITWEADVVRAFATRRPILDLQHANAYALGIAQLLKRLFPGDVSERVDRWLLDQKQSRSEPYLNAMRTIEAEIATVVETDVKLSQRAERRRNLFSLGGGLGVLGLGVAFMIGYPIYSVTTAELALLTGMLGVAVAAFSFGAKLLGSRTEADVRTQKQLLELRLADLKEQHQRYRALFDATDALVAPRGEISQPMPSRDENFESSGIRRAPS